MGLIRLLLALSVVTAHTKPLLGIPWLAMTGGLPSVQLFFVISGFYMSLILRDKYRGPGSYRRFLLSRFLRLWPTYLVVLAMTIVVSMLVHWRMGYHLYPVENFLQGWPHFSTLTALVLLGATLMLVGQDVIMFLALNRDTGGLYFTKNFSAEPSPMFRYLLCQPAWSLGSELLFYAIAPLLLRGSSLLLAGVSALGVGIHLFLGTLSALPLDPWNYRFFPTELPFFLVGALAHHAYRWLLERQLLAPRAGKAAFGIVVAAIVAFPSLPFENGYLSMLLFCILFAGALPWIFHLLRDSKRDRWIGELSYPLYLSHWSIWLLLVCPPWPWLKAHIGDVTVVVSLLVSVALCRFVVGPVDRFRARITGADSARGDRKLSRNIAA